MMSLIHILFPPKAIKGTIRNSSSTLPSPPLVDRLGPQQRKAAIYDWIANGIGYFKEWYQAVDFGNGIVAHMTVAPDWKPHPEMLHHNEGGLAKWNHILKKHIPDLHDKRVLDIGSSSGLFCLEMARMGAREVIGIDRNESIKHRSTRVPPPQDVIAQANFVKKAFELLHDTTYPIQYIAHDIGDLGSLHLGKFDFILAANVIYHELENMPALLRQLGKMTDHVVLQTCLAHGGSLGEWASVSRHVDILLEIGFTYIEIDAPKGYALPVIVAHK